MSSPQLHTQISPRQHLATQLVDGQHEPSTASNPPRRGFASRARRSAIAIAIAAGSAAILASGPYMDASAQLTAASAMSAPHVGATSASFVRRILALEAAGYLDYSCAVHGEQMFNPRLHRYVTVPVRA